MGLILGQLALVVQWLSHQTMGWYVLGSHLSTGTNPERIKVQWVGIDHCPRQTDQTAQVCVQDSVFEP